MQVIFGTFLMVSLAANNSTIRLKLDSYALGIATNLGVRTRLGTFSVWSAAER